MIAAGAYGYLVSQSVVSFMTGALLGTALCLLSWFIRIGISSAGYAAGCINFLLAIYFAYRFIATERFIMAGVLLILSFITLFLLILGVFLGLWKEHLEVARRRIPRD
jgi:uncharacterized membrane protein (UPF0136 family)